MNEFYSMTDWYNENENYIFQLFSRNNDVNGNPYRLIVVYDSTGYPVKCYEDRDSSPNIENYFYGLENMSKIMTIHLATKEYNKLKKSFNTWHSPQSDYSEIIGVVKL